MRIVLLLALVLSHCHLQAEPPVAKPAKQTALRMSPETTSIVEPLDERGFVDYVAAVNQRISRNLNPEDNYEVAVRQIVSVDHVPESIRKEYFERLGIEVPKVNADAISFETGFRKAVQGHAVHGAADKQFEFLQNNLWDVKEFPQVANWLRQENERLNQLVKASRRPRNYLPLICPKPDGDQAEGSQMMRVSLPSTQYQRDFARAFAIRINGNIASGELDAAWADILATMRIGRLNACGTTLLELIVGTWIDAHVFPSTVELLRSEQLTEQQLARMLADLKQMPYLSSLAENIDKGERYFGLDVIQSMSKHESIIEVMKEIALLGFNEWPRATTLVMQRPDEAKPRSEDDVIRATTLIDWNESAKVLNKWYDKSIEYTKIQDYAEREASKANFKEEMRKVRSKSRGVMGPLGHIATLKNRKEVGRFVGEALVTTVVPMLFGVSDREYESRARLDLLRLAFATELFRRRNGGYPKKLAELTPDYLANIPADYFSTNPLQYIRPGRGFAIYSVGLNGKNDLGRSREDANARGQQVQWDDVVVRVKK